NSRLPPFLHASPAFYASLLSFLSCTSSCSLCSCLSFSYCSFLLLVLHSFPTRRSSDLYSCVNACGCFRAWACQYIYSYWPDDGRSEEHTSELQSRFDFVCRLLLEKKNNTYHYDFFFLNFCKYFIFMLFFILKLLFLYSI